MPSPLTASQITAAVQMIAEVGRAIRELKEVPSGHLYAQLSSVLSLADYEAIIQRLKATGLIEVSHAHLITWKG